LKWILQLKNWRKITLDWIALIAPFASNEGIDETPHETYKAKNPRKYKKFCK
jgi:hypothetical protein